MPVRSAERERERIPDILLPPPAFPFNLLSQTKLFGTRSARSFSSRHLLRRFLEKQIKQSKQFPFRHDPSRRNADICSGEGRLASFPFRDRDRQNNEKSARQRDSNGKSSCTESGGECLGVGERS